MKDAYDIHAQLATSLHFTPLIDWQWLALLCVIGVLLLGLSVFYHKQALGWRLFMFTLFMLVLLNPSLLKEDRHYTKDVVAIINSDFLISLLLSSLFKIWFSI